MQRKRVLVAFGDVNGFTSYTRRAINAVEEKRYIVNRIYNEFAKLAERNPSFSVKYTGDGFMALVELNGRPKPKIVINFLREVYTVAMDVLNSLRKASGPEFFRVRCTNGFAFKKMMTERNMGGRVGRRRIPEYVDYPVSLADRLLEVYPDEHLCVLHSSVKKLLGEGHPGMKLTALEPPAKCPPGVDPEDVEELFSFEFDLKESKRKA